MASRVQTSEQACEAASAYISQQYPASLAGELSLLRLADNWVVQTSVVPLEDDEPASMVVLVVNRHGFVEEVGRGSVARQSVHRCLAGVQAMTIAEKVACEV